MQQIDISRIKNIDENLSDIEILELNGIFNSPEIHNEILKTIILQKAYYKKFS